MGKRKRFRADRKRKRHFGGNQYTNHSQTDLSDSDEDREEHEFVAPCAFDSGANDEGKKSPTTISNQTASTSKLAGVDLKPHENFDADPELTGFRSVDVELLIDFVQSLLCPHCH